MFIDITMACDLSFYRVLLQLDVVLVSNIIITARRRSQSVYKAIPFSRLHKHERCMLCKSICVMSLIKNTVRCHVGFFLVAGKVIRSTPMKLSMT